MHQAPLIVHTESTRLWGGQEIRVLAELAEMRARGFRVALIAPEGTPIATRARNAGIAVHALPSFSKFHPTTWLRVGRTLRRLRPTVLNTHSSEDSWIAALLARALGVPLILRTRHVLSVPHSTFSYRFPHELLACSEAIAETLNRRGMFGKRVNVIPTGNDAARFRFSPEKRAEMRRRFGLGEADILIGNVSFLRDYKGQRFILDTLAGLDKRYWAMLVGDGDQLADLEAWAARLGVGERVFFVGYQERPEDFLQAFDLFFFSSYESEGVSQSLVQALLNGLPVLACADCSSNAEVLADIAVGRLVAYGDTAAAAATLAELAPLSRRDPATMAAQHETVAARYGLPVMMTRILELYARYGIVPPIDEKGG